MRKAWIEDDRIRDIAPAGDPFEFYHPDVAVFYDTEVPDDACNGDGWVDGVLVKPQPVVPEVIDVVPEVVEPAPAEPAPEAPTE